MHCRGKVKKSLSLFALCNPCYSMRKKGRCLVRILKDILAGIVSGIIIIFLMGNLVPQARSLYQEFFQNAKLDLEEWVGQKSEETTGTDFTKLFAEGKRIADQNAYHVKDSGISGEGTSFDAAYNPYYAMLDEDEKTLYGQMYANAENASASFAPEVQVSKDQVNTVFEAVFYDHPELFWLDTGYSYRYTDDGKIVEIDLKFNETANDLENAKAAFNNAAQAIITQAKQYPDAVSQERYVHDAIIDETDYDLNASLNQSAYSALVNHSTVCAGYAKAFQYIMDQLGIPAYYVTGTSENEDHAWNIVVINGVNTNVDLTWDDTSGERYRFFNLSDGEMSSSHTRTGLSVNLPACN